MTEKETHIRLTLRLRKHLHAALVSGESMNAFINDAVQEKIDRESRESIFVSALHEELAEMARLIALQAESLNDEKLSKRATSLATKLESLYERPEDS